MTKMTEIGNPARSKRRSPCCPPVNRKADPEIIRKLAAQSKTRAEIAERLGCSYETLVSTARRYGIEIVLAPNPIHEASLFWAANDARLIQMVEDGASTSEAARKLGLTKNKIIGRAYRLGLTWARLPSGVKPAQPRVKIEFPSGGHCVFPIGHPGDAGFHFCGERTEGLLRPYCQQHHRVCYRPAPVMAEAA